MEEIWKPVAGYELHYFVSNTGRIKATSAAAIESSFQAKANTGTAVFSFTSMGRG